MSSSERTVMEIAGHVSPRMLARYSHIRHTEAAPGPGESESAEGA
jgi:hypothetical protein